MAQNHVNREEYKYMADTQCKTCRHVGQKLFLKEEKCFGPKCPIIRKPYAPGKKPKRPKPLSEYGQQLKEKQKLKFSYGLREKQFSNYIKSAMQKRGSNIIVQLIKFLESRLDNVVFRLGLAKSRSAARQMVSHGLICVNGKKIDVPSFQTKKGNKISIKSQKLPKKIFADLDLSLKKYNPPTWLKLDKEKKEGEVIRGIQKEDVEISANMNAIIEFYSK